MKNTFVKVLSFMMALMMVVGMFSVVTFAADAECAHDDCTRTEVPASCFTAGFTKVKCNKCDWEDIENVVPATGKHTWIAMPKEDATCTTPAYSAYEKCAYCPEINPEKPRTQTGDKIGHVWTEYVVTEPATCAKEGFKSPKCLVCKEYDKENETGKYVKLDKLAHELVYNVTTKPEPCKEGVVTVTCANCTTYKEEIVQQPIHNWVTLASQGMAGFTCDQYVSGNICKDCRTIQEGAVLNNNVTCTFVKVAGIGTTGKDTAITEANLTAELVKLGYAVNDPLHKEATCASAGYYYGFCARHNEYRKVPVSNDKIQHAYGANVAKTNASIAANAADCTKAAYTWEKCACGAEKSTLRTAAKAAHSYKNEGAIAITTPWTCTANGYTTYNCDNCAETHNELINYATGHNWGVAVKPATYDCTKGYTAVQTCTNPQCDTDLNKEGKQPATNDVVVAPVANHTWAETYREVGATCVTPAHYERYCTKCTVQTAEGVPADKKPVDDPAARADQHIAYINTKANGVIDADEVVQAQSCTTALIEKFICACGDIVNVTTAPALGHTSAADGAVSKVINGKTVSLAAVTATCQLAAKTEGKFCGRAGCTEIVLQQVTGNKAPQNHVLNGNPVAGVEVDRLDEANCTVAAYVEYYFTCCQKIDRIYNVKEDAVNANNHVTTPKAAVEPTCTANGNYAYDLCTLCGKTFIGGVEKSAADLVWKNPGNDFDHKWPEALTEEYEAEQCNVPGTRAYYDCEDCAAIKLQENGRVVIDNPATKNVDEAVDAYTIPAHGKAYMGYYSNLNKAPTCDKPGVSYPETYCCKLCDKTELRATNCEGTVYDLPINLNEDGTVENCTKESYVLHICSKCGKSSMTDYNKAKNPNGHKYTQVDGVDKRDDFDPADCINPGVDYFYCTECDHIDERAGEAAKGHSAEIKDGVFVAISVSCKDIDNFNGWACAACGGVVNKDVEGRVVNDDDSITLGYEHRHVQDSKDATCSAIGYEIEYCADCNVVFTSTSTPAINHKGYSFVTGSKDSTTTELGYTNYECRLCGETWSETIALKPTIAGDIAIVLDAINTIEDAGKTFTDSSKIAVTVALQGINAGVSAINLNLTYSNNLVFAGYEFATGHGFTTFQNAVDNNDDSYDKKGAFVEGNPDFVSISAATDFDETKAPVDYVVDGTVQLVTLYFEVNNSESSAADAWVKVTKADVVNDEQKNLKVAENKQFDIKVAMFMDINGNKTVTMADLLAAAQIFTELKYDVTVDVDKDGEITLADLMAIMDYINGALTYDQIAALKA